MREWGPGPDKRGDHGRRRTEGRIEHGGGNGGEPARSPPGRPSYGPTACVLWAHDGGGRALKSEIFTHARHFVSTDAR